MLLLQAALAKTAAARSCIAMRRVAFFGFWSIFVQLLHAAIFRHLEILSLRTSALNSRPPGFAKRIFLGIEIFDTKKKAFKIFAPRKLSLDLRNFYARKRILGLLYQSIHSLGLRDLNKKSGTVLRFRFYFRLCALPCEWLYRARRACVCT